VIRNAACLSVLENEDDPPLVVDANAIRAREVALEFLQVVSGTREVGELGGGNFDDQVSRNYPRGSTSFTRSANHVRGAQVKST